MQVNHENTNTVYLLCTILMQFVMPIVGIMFPSSIEISLLVYGYFTKSTINFQVVSLC